MSYDRQAIMKNLHQQVEDLWSLYLKDLHGIQHRCQGVRLRVIVPVRKSPDLDSVYLADIPSLHNQPEFG